LKVYLILLIIGGLFFVFGIANFGYYTNYLIEEHPDLIFLMNEIQIPGNSQFSTQLALDEGVKQTVTVIVHPNPNPVFFSINRPDNSVASEIIFNDLLSYPFSTNSSGIYTITIGNMGTSNILVSSFITENPVIDTKFILSITSNLIISSITILVGPLLLIVGIGIFVYQRKYSKSKLN